MNKAVFFAALALNFQEVNPTRTSPEFQKYIQSGIAKLKANKSDISRFTLKSIEDHRVLIDELPDLTRNDYLVILRDFEFRDVKHKLHPADYEDIQDRDSRAFKELQKQLDGTMSSNRIYVGDDQSPAALAATLVHEINHVLNHSDKGYMTRGQTYAFLQEYRAFYVEAMFRGKNVTRASFAPSLKKYVLKEYGFPEADVDSIPDVPSGELIPTNGAWAKRP